MHLIYLGHGIAKGNAAIYAVDLQQAKLAHATASGRLASRVPTGRIEMRRVDIGIVQGGMGRDTFNIQIAFFPFAVNCRSCGGIISYAEISVT